jgi:hypothetical protein
MGCGSQTKPLLEPPAKPLPPPTRDEIYQAIPPQGITIVDFAAQFNGRISMEEEGFRTLIRLVSTVATIDVETMSIWPKFRPTRKEVRDAVPPEGVTFNDFTSRFNWFNLPEDMRQRISKYLELIATPDAETSTIRLLGVITLEEVVAAIPSEGITGIELRDKFLERFKTRAENYPTFMRILGQVAAWDPRDHMRLFLHDRK